jgi:hypothetical protein
MAESDDPVLTGNINLGELVLQVGTLVVLGGAGILGYQGFLWLKDGYWTAMPIGRFLPQSSNIDWSGARGVEQIWNSVLDFPSSASVMAVGFAVAVFGAWYSNEAFTRQQAARRRKLLGERE